MKPISLLYIKLSRIFEKTNTRDGSIIFEMFGIPLFQVDVLLSPVLAYHENCLIPLKYYICQLGVSS